MNLYDLHPNPETLKHYRKRFEVPELALVQAIEIFRKTHKRVPKLEKSIGKSPRYSYVYAERVTHEEGFPEGEPAIATDAMLSYKYAVYIIHSRFHEGEPTIAKNRRYADEYNHKFGTEL